MKYKIVSGRLAEGKAGQIVDSSDLAGCNIGALLDSGHIVPVEAKIKADVKSESAED
jgi:hypothetical protein